MGKLEGKKRKRLEPTSLFLKQAKIKMPILSANRTGGVRKDILV